MYLHTHMNTRACTDVHTLSSSRKAMKEIIWNERLLFYCWVATSDRDPELMGKFRGFFGGVGGGNASQELHSSQFAFFMYRTGVKHQAAPPSLASSCCVWGGMGGAKL